MAKEEKVSTPGAPAVGMSDMPDVEPGHKGYDGRPEVFDPNAARRNVEGRGPGLQDSEILQPAHWAPTDPVEVTKVQLERRQKELEAELDAVKADMKDLGK